MWQSFRKRLVSDAHEAWRWLSIQFAVLAGALEAFQESVRQGWISIPEDLKATLPAYVGKAIGLAILASIIGRLWRQKPRSEGQ